MDHHHTHIIKPAKFHHLEFKELWRFRELFLFFTWRDIKVKYKQTLLGFVWAILQPLVLMGIFSLFFSNILRISTDNIPAPIFYFSGLLLWNLFNGGLSGSAASMVDNANIIKKIYFPRLIIPTSAVLSSLFDFFMGIVVFVGLMTYYSYIGAINFSWKFIPFYGIAILLTLLTTLGWGFLLSALNVKYRDFRYIIPFFTQFLFFVSPVIYPVSILSENGWMKYILAINPLTGALTLARSTFSNIPPDYSLIGISAGAAFILFIIGLIYFKKTEAHFADLA